MPRSDERGGALTIVGTGIRPGLHTTSEARACIERADKVLYLIAEDAPTAWIHRLNPSAESMASIYRLGRPYAEVYEEIVTTILAWVRRELNVCAVTYGHPRVFDQSTSDAANRARAEGYHTKILPGISAQDCLFVDLELDPGEDGCQTFDATDFLVHRRSPDVTVPLILWQISLIGSTRTTVEVNRSGLVILAERLAELYAEDHEVVAYEASPFPVGRPNVDRCTVSGLPQARVTGMASLYVPPKSKPSPDPVMRARLGLPPAPAVA